MGSGQSKSSSSKRAKSAEATADARRKKALRIEHQQFGKAQHGTAHEQRHIKHRQK